jgi:hypothetical protein
MKRLVSPGAVLLVSRRCCHTSENKMSRARIGLLVGALFVAFPAACVPLVTIHMQRQSLPQKLRTTWFYAAGSCNILLSHQGAFAFGLRQETISQLELQGIKFFDDIRSAENGVRRSYFSNRDWRETPVSDMALGHGVTFNLHCGPAHSWLWPRGVETALKRPGSYYTDSGPRGLFVIPSLGLVVASASDR